MCSGLFKQPITLMDDGSQLCKYIGEYLQLDPLSVWKTVVDYISDNPVASRALVAKFDFMSVITLKRYVDFLKSPHIKFDKFSLCMLSKAFKMHICMFMMNEVWYSSEGLEIADCKLFLVYKGNMTFMYIPVTGTLLPNTRDVFQDHCLTAGNFLTAPTNDKSTVN